MESKIPVLRFASYAKLKKMVNNLREKKLEESDKRLIRGLFEKKMKDILETNTITSLANNIKRAESLRDIISLDSVRILDKEKIK
jgi:hypothetical protein